jgi:hypothetical protein
MATDDNEKAEKVEAEKVETTEAPAAEPVIDPEATSIGEKADEKAEPEVVEPVAAAPVTTAEADAAKHDDESPGFAEPDRINVGMILAITIGIVISTVAVVIGVREFFSQTIAGEVNKKVLEPEDPLKKELYVAEQAKLTKYQWVSQKDGVVRIPLARAKELVLADYGKMAAYDPKAVSPHPAPSASAEPGPAPDPAASSSVAPSGSGSAAPAPSVAPPASAFGSAATSASASAPAPKHSAPHKH